MGVVMPKVDEFAWMTMICKSCGKLGREHPYAEIILDGNRPTCNAVGEESKDDRP